MGARSWQRRAWLVACGALLVLASCTGGSGAGESSDAPSSALDTYYDQEPVWTGCLKAKGECTGVDVPLDYAHPDGESVNLSLRRLPARVPDERVGSLFINPGGPGVSGVRAVDGFAKAASPDLRDRFDIVGFDPRGIAESEGLECFSGMDPAVVRGVDYDPETDAEARRFLRMSKAIGHGCVDWDESLARHMSTVEGARDLDVLRAVVGDDDLSYVGLSYGTVLGSDYAELFPDRVGRMVLDGALDQTRSVGDVTLAQTRGQQRALEAYAEDCADRGCPLGTSKRDVLKRIQRLLITLDRRPLASGRPGRPLTRNRAQTAIVAGLMGQWMWPELTKSLGLAVRGDVARLSRMGDSYYGYSTPTPYLSYAGQATSCLDQRDRPTLAEVRRSTGRYARASAIFGPTMSWSRMTCSVWPVPPAEESLEIDGKGADPIVVVGSYGDPLTPYKHAVSLSKQLESAVLLSSNTYTHTAYQMGSRCIDRAVHAYLVEGEVPEDGTVC